MDKIIEVKDVSMRFLLQSQRVNNLKEYLIRKIKKDLKQDEFWALKNVSVSVERGRNLGIIGLNGSGKSTLLKLIAGVLKPTSGTVRTYGTVAPLIELGAGFDPELTAYENVFLNGAILGYSRDFLKSKMDEIVDFSELGSFLYVPIKNFSSGMVARLGFSIATMVQPDIIILDEILSVGDFHFQAKCEQRMEHMMKTGTTIIIVSHSVEQVKKICSDVLWLNRGEVVMYGGAEEVCDAYAKS